jgi:LPXTG-site transpeptidase (sortase) family protein
MTNARLRLINKMLFGAIILINAYIILAPLFPTLTFWVQSKDPEKKQTLSQIIEQGDGSQDTGDENRLIVPDMLLDTPVIEGPVSKNEALLREGAWRLPYSSTPDKGGNTVVVGHRFSYTGPRGIFYYLDKLKPGSEIGLQWGGKMYRYSVESSRTVPDTAIEVEAPTEDARLTLYTCTPLWNPVNRLVVVAKPISESPS